jgi:hypothetical protein
MTFWEGQLSKEARRVLVIPNITNSANIEKDSFVDVIYNHIKGLEQHGEYFWNIILPEPVKKLNLLNVKQHILPFSGDMIKMRTYPPDFNRLLETLEYDVIYSHLPDWPQIGRYKNDFNTKIIGYCHWWEMKTCNAEDRKNKWRWMPIELLGISQMETCYLNTQDQKNRVLEEAKIWFNDEFVKKLDDILVVWNLGLPKQNVIESASEEKRNIIVFNHRAAAYKGYPTFIKLMEEYRERRQDFSVWVPQLKGTPEHNWIDATKLPKHEYYTRLQQCKVGIQMRQTNYGWSVSATDCLMNGTPMIYQESLCYQEIEPNGLFFKFKKDLFEMLDKILDDDNYRKDREIKSIERALELSQNEGKMLQQLNIKLKA